MLWVGVVVVRVCLACGGLVAASSWCLVCFVGLLCHVVVFLFSGL